MNNQSIDGSTATNAGTNAAHVSGKNKNDLTKNETMVLDVLSSADGAIGAYAILDTLRTKGVSAPPTVYRALSQLIEKGLVKRIESTRKFVAVHKDTPEDAVAVCNICGSVASLSYPELALDLKNGAINSGFEVDCYAIEILGKCSDCTSEKQQ